MSLFATCSDFSSYALAEADSSGNLRDLMDVWNSLDRLIEDSWHSAFPH
jgi:hypothetical protein